MVNLHTDSKEFAFDIAWSSCDLRKSHVKNINDKHWHSNVETIFGRPCSVGEKITINPPIGSSTDTVLCENIMFVFETIACEKPLLSYKLLCFVFCRLTIHWCDFALEEEKKSTIISTEERNWDRYIIRIELHFPENQHFQNDDKKSGIPKKRHQKHTYHEWSWYCTTYNEGDKNQTYWSCQYNWTHWGGTGIAWKKSVCMVVIFPLRVNISMSDCMLDLRSSEMSSGRENKLPFKPVRL